MRVFTNRLVRAGLAALLALPLTAAPLARAQDKPLEFKVGRQPGLIYLPLYVMDEQGLLAKHATRLGLGPTVLRLVDIGSAAGISDMLLSGSIDAAAGAITPLLTLWDKTRGAQKVKAMASLSNSVLYLNANNPALKSLRDITSQDRIALSGVGFSMQATLLQMAAGQTFGDGQENRLDPLTVSMPHPEGLAALLSVDAHIISAHFTTTPFQNLELRNPRIHRLLTSTDILGGYAPAALAFTTQRVHDGNPRLVEAFVAAADEADAWIAAHAEEAAALYLRREPQKLSVAEIREILVNGDTVFTTTPENSLKIATFMAKLGRLGQTPKDWTDYYFPFVGDHGKRGS
jgi:NitT/TauT family transport system substrate-binding protein